MDKQDKQAIELLNKETKKSDYYRQLSRVKYKSPKGYCRYEESVFKIARELLGYHYVSDETLNESLSKAEIIDLIVSSSFYKEGFKPFWLSNDLMKAFLASDLPKELGEIQRVIHNGILFFPELVSPLGKKVSWIAFKHSKANEEFSNFEQKGRTIKFPYFKEDRLNWFYPDSDLSQIIVSFTLKPTKSGCILDENVLIQETDLNSEERSDPEKEELLFSASLSRLLLQSLLYLQTTIDPQDLKTVLNQTHGFGSNSSKQLLRPFIIGSDYKTRYEVEYNLSSSSNTKKRESHWRRGHWRKQPFGSRESPQFKNIWIEPIFINSGYLIK